MTSVREIMTAWIFTEPKYRALDLVALKFFHAGLVFGVFFLSAIMYT